MEFKFDADQDFQLQAIKSITDLFAGQPYLDADFTALGDVHAIENRLDLDDETLLENLWRVQDDNKLDLDDALLPTANRANGLDLPYYNFSVEMETGTGKTYVYLRTALELNRKYGFRKFIIVVPSIAIREGVLKTLQVTEKHFRNLYNNLPYRYYDYDSENLSLVRQFALSSDLELMVLTIDSFNKELNITRQPQERLNGDVPIHLLQATRPILILDEPQSKMEGERNKEALGELHPLLTLRYSATHRNPYNRVYRLTPYEAYRQRLVKKVDVWGITQENDLNRAYIELREIKTVRRKMQAKLQVNQLARSGNNISRKSVKISHGDNLYAKTRLPEYHGITVDRIEHGRVYIMSGMQEIALTVGESVGEDKDAIFQAQIRTAIEEHFRRQNDLREKGIKVLSLFFIDRVANYQEKFCRMFDEAYAELAGQERYARWQGQDPGDVRAAYFAKKSQRQDDWKDTRGESAADKAAYDLIMRDKERLLSFDEPTAFIFSHSALNEGWDNPNIFQICTLRDVRSYTTKRQQIGRGVRLPVDQNGDRIHDEHGNVLTVIANESYGQFVKSYQQEIERDYGSSSDVAEPGNARERKRVKRKESFGIDPHFQALWDRIKHKTRYSVRIDTGRLIADSADALKKSLDDKAIKPPPIIAIKESIELSDESDDFTGIETKRREMGSATARPDLVDLARLVAISLQDQRPPLSLSRRTILSIIVKSGGLAEGIQNPKVFAMRVARVICETLGGHLVDGIQYERIDDCYDMRLFDPEQFESAAKHLPKARKSIFNRVECDSQVECNFVNSIDNRADIPLHIKLPSGFRIATPVGSYNPDWAIVVNKDDAEGEKCYLVRETKGGPDMRSEEERKTKYAKKHFDTLGVNYEVITPENFQSISC